MQVILPFVAGRSGRVTTRNLDLRDPSHCDDLIRYLALMSDTGLREVLNTMQAEPAYAQNWNGTKRVLADLTRRLG